MNKKVFIKNRPFDVNDATQMQTYTEDALKNTMKTIYTSGIVQGLNVIVNTGLSLKVNLGYGFDSNYNLINVQSQQTINLSTASSANPRIDLVVIKNKKTILDNIDGTNKYGFGTSFIYSQNELDDFQISIIAGTPAVSPTVPSTPIDSLALASIYVAQNATSITSGNITDLRQLLTINQNINQPEVVIGTTQPTNINTLWIDMN